MKTSRRNFLATMLAGAAATVLPAPKRKPKLRINPAWVSAPYQAEIIMAAGVGAYAGLTFAVDPFPMRFRMLEEGGECHWEPIKGT